MDQINHKILPKLAQTITSSNFLKKATKLLISISLCSFLFSSYSSWYSNFFLHSMNNSHSTFPFSIDKNYVFLIFNGILVFIAKTSGSFHFNSNDYRSLKNIGNCTPNTSESVNLGREVLTEDHDDTCYNLMEEVEGIRLSDHEYLKEECHEEQEGKSGKLLDDEHVGDEEQEGKLGKLFDDDQKDEEQHERAFMDKSRENEMDSHGGDDRLYADDEEKDGRLEEKEMNNIGFLSTEELNKKFDEFIRKMKEEIRIEAQRTLIMV